MRADELSALELQRMLHESLDTDQIAVRVYGASLVIDVITPGGAVTVARLKLLPGNRYGLGFKRHTGAWTPLPYAGPLEAMAETTVQQLRGHLDPRNYDY